jgi:hypothetical protein
MKSDRDGTNLPYYMFFADSVAGYLNSLRIDTKVAADTERNNIITQLRETFTHPKIHLIADFLEQNIITVDELAHIFQDIPRTTPDSQFLDQVLYPETITSNS